MASIEDAENYVVNAKCECPNRYDSEPPLCIGLIKKPGDVKARRNWADNLRLRRKIKQKEFQFVEVKPSGLVSRHCKGPFNNRYPIVGCKNGKRVIAVIQRLHFEVEGDEDKVRNPNCPNTHAVVIVVLPHMPATPVLNPCETLVKLIGGAEPTRHGVTQCSLIEKLKCSHGLLDESDLPENLRGRSWNFGCSYNERNVLKFYRDGLIIQGAGCNGRTQLGEAEDVDKFKNVIDPTLKEEVKATIESLATDADLLLSDVASNTANRFRSEVGCRWTDRNPFSTSTVVIDHFCAPHKASKSYMFGNIK